MEQEREEINKLDEFELGDIIRRAFFKHGNHAWVSIGKEVLDEIKPIQEQPETMIPLSEAFELMKFVSNSWFYNNGIWEKWGEHTETKNDSEILVEFIKYKENQK